MKMERTSNPGAAARTNAHFLADEAGEIARRLKRSAEQLEGGLALIHEGKRPKREAIALAHQHGAAAVDEIMQAFTVGIIHFARTPRIDAIVANPAAAWGDAKITAKHGERWKPEVFRLIARELLPWLENECLQSPTARDWAKEETAAQWDIWAADVIRAFATVFAHLKQDHAARENIGQTGATGICEQLRDAIQQVLFYASHPPKSRDEESECEAATNFIRNATPHQILIPGKDSEAWLHAFKTATIQARQVPPSSEALITLQRCQDELWGVAEGAETTQQPPARPTPAIEPARMGNNPNELKNGWMGDVHLAEALGVHPSQLSAFRAKLRRMREDGKLSADDWQEVENRKRNEPQFLYRSDAPLILALTPRYSFPK